jgi:two-component system LytT family response regulator
VFLDVQMPGHNGFEVIEAVGADRMPTVIFVTAYDEYALKAFEVHALDYLLKPFGRDRFQQTLQHARAILERRRRGDLGPRLLALVNDIKTEPGPTRLDRLVVKSGGRVFFLRTDQIDWIEAAGNYVRLHLGDESHLFRETMNRMEARLDGRRFVRIHRSRIVNTERVKELQPWFNGEHVVILQNGTRLTLSRGYREKLQEQLKRGRVLGRLQPVPEKKSASASSNAGSRRRRQGVVIFRRQFGDAPEGSVAAASRHLDQIQLGIHQPVLAHARAAKSRRLICSSVFRVPGR